MRFVLLAGLFLAVIDLYLLFRIFVQAGFVTGMAVLVLPGLIGGRVAVSQGRGVLRKIEDEAAGGKVPSAEVVESLLLLYAGFLLLYPGPLTAGLGLLLLLPPLRRLAARIGIRWFKRRASSLQGLGASGASVYVRVYPAPNAPRAAPAPHGLKTVEGEVLGEDRGSELPGPPGEPKPESPESPQH